MKILVNTSTLKATGVTQVAVSFLNECKLLPDHDYLVFLSPKVAENIEVNSFPQNFKFWIFGEKSLYTFWGIKDMIEMKSIERNEKPDVVFSVFGPSLWSPHAPHLQGFAYPYYIYPDSPVYDRLSLKEWFSVKIHKIIHMSLLKHNGDFFVCETFDVATRLSKIFKIDRSKVFVTYNTANGAFMNYKRINNKRVDNEFRFFTLCSPYKHKNMEILNAVIPYLERYELSKKIKFYITFPKERYEKAFSAHAKRYIVNVGPLRVADCPQVVDQCDALFLPTLLECYSASYPEAMCLKKAIITSDLPFAKTVCGDAALYFNPLNPKEIASVIKTLVESTTLYNDLINKGNKRLQEFGTSLDRAKSYLDICQNIINNNYENKE